jgi:ubiquitin
MGAGAKHKKKVYTTKKKNKHRHIKEKLATLRVSILIKVLYS